VITRGLEFLVGLMPRTTDGEVHVVPGEGHFYIRKPDILGRLIGETVVAAL